jgi:hypothetical protein
MAIQAPFAEELSGLQNSDDRFLALVGYDSELDPAFLDVKNRIRDLSLRENNLILPVLQNRLPPPHSGEKDLGIEYVLGGLPHRASPLWIEGLCNPNVYTPSKNPILIPDRAGMEIG